MAVAIRRDEARVLAYLELFGQWKAQLFHRELHWTMFKAPALQPINLGQRLAPMTIRVVKKPVTSGAASNWYNSKLRLKIEGALHAKAARGIEAHNSHQLL